MTSILAHGGSAGLAAELLLLSLPVVGFGLLWWWNRRLGRSAEGRPEPAGAEPLGQTVAAAPPEERSEGDDLRPDGGP